MLKTFTGFRGYAAVFEIGGVEFVVLAGSQVALAQLHELLLPDSVTPFDPAKCKKSVLIEAKLLPEETKP